MPLMTCAGVDVLDAEIHLCARGAWWARARLDSSKTPSGRVTLSAEGGLSLSGFVVTGGVFTDVSHVHIVGGAGGLSKVQAAAAWQNAQLRDPLDAALSAAGESLSSTVASTVLSVQLPAWTRAAETTVRAIDGLCGAASAATGQAITWRVLPDGAVWLGVETWPAQDIPAGSDLLEAFPAEGRYVIGADTPSLLPGVALAGVGNVVAVDHWITPHEVRTWALV